MIAQALAALAGNLVALFGPVDWPAHMPMLLGGLAVACLLRGWLGGKWQLWCAELFLNLFD